jgi:hypothetical protein
LWAGLIFLALAPIVTVAVFKYRFEALALEEDSVLVEGKVAHLWIASFRRSVHYQVEYEYSSPPAADAQIFRNQTEIGEQYFKRLHEGGPIAVKVCCTDVAKHQVVGEPPRVFSSVAAMFVCLGVAAVLAMAGAANLGWWWICRRQIRPDRVFVLHFKELG